MGKFILIDSMGESERTTLLNLDWIAKVELSHGDIAIENKRVHLKCISDDAFTLATLYFEDIDSAHRWVFAHLEVQL